jgi:hypothetical protein
VGKSDLVFLRISKFTLGGREIVCSQIAKACESLLPAVLAGDPRKKNIPGRKKCTVIVDGKTVAGG